MPNITAIVTAYRRPQNIEPLVEAIRRQLVPPAAIWCWANDPGEKMKAVLAKAKFDRVVTCSDNARFHVRFALALLARTEFVAIFDDDSIPGDLWFANCSETMGETPGILGTAGVVLDAPRAEDGLPSPSRSRATAWEGRPTTLTAWEGHPPDYARRTMHGWQRPSDKAVEVDLVGQAWFLRTEWIKYLFAAPPVTGTNGEDIELAARAWRLAGIRSFCPPHPSDDTRKWGSTRGLELGLDEVAASGRVEHLAERRKIVEAEVAAGWRPLCMRMEGSGFGVQGSVEETEGQREGETERPREDESENYVQSVTDCCPRWVTQYSYPIGDNGEATTTARVSLRFDGGDEKSWCLDCIDDLESLGHSDAAGPAVPQYDNINLGPALERVRDPLTFLRRAHRLLKAGGEVVASVANVRRQAVIERLIYGRWAEEGSGFGVQGSETVGNALPGIPLPVRFYTEAELEKLFYRAGFRIGERIRTCSTERPSAAVKSLTGMPRADEFQYERYRVTAMPEARSDYGLTSIVILTHNQLAYTRACLESIRFLTDEPYELIVVDNGSTDGTVEFLRSCPDVKRVENADNRGFPAAANQGIKASTGAQVLLLNNDVLVTTGWLRRMLDALKGSGFGVQGSVDETEGRSERETEVGNSALSVSPSPFPAISVQAALTPALSRRARENHAHPSSLISHPSSSHIGLVGPLTNCASGYQEIPVTYSDTSCLDGFAWEHAKQHRGELQEVDRLIGFCLLIRRQVIDQVGLLDERFGIGNYEDDDYCRRARNAGWRLVVARDAFIHHFGHKTFDGAGVDLNALLVKNRQVYEEKWALEGSGFGVQGSAETSEVRTQESEVSEPMAPTPPSLIRSVSPSRSISPSLPLSVPPSPPPSLISHPSSLILSLCMIVRNNAGTIRPCLESAKPWVDEVIVVDTGSTDETPQICRELGAQVYHMTWPDSFSVARNESLKYAKSEWIFWMDSDDVIDAENGRKLRELVVGLAGAEQRAGSTALTPALSQREREKSDGLGRPSSGGDGQGRPPHKNVMGYVMQVHCPGNGLDGMHDVTVVDHLKLFRNRPDIRFEGRIHEQVLDAINRAKGDIVFTDIFVVHAGADHTPEGRKRKLMRDIKLLRLDLHERPNANSTRSPHDDLIPCSRKRPA